MTTSVKSTGTEAEGTRKKGGADGKAKSSAPNGRRPPETSAPADAAQTGLKSRKITTKRR